ncbi:uncharacterized protein LOC144018973 isoform X2 [Festucalex cinctus]
MAGQVNAAANRTHKTTTTRSPNASMLTSRPTNLHWDVDNVASLLIKDPGRAARRLKEHLDVTCRHFALSTSTQRCKRGVQALLINRCQPEGLEAKSGPPYRFMRPAKAK